VRYAPDRQLFLRLKFKELTGWLEKSKLESEWWVMGIPPT
jgi:hypothetical protein